MTAPTVEPAIHELMDLGSARFLAFAPGTTTRETVGSLVCGSKNDHSVRYSLSPSTSPIAAACTYDKLPSVTVRKRVE